MRILAILLLWCVVTGVRAQTPPPLLPPGLSDYQQFRVYPWLVRARDAQARGDHPAALESYRHAYRLASDNVELALRVARAWHQAGHDGKARQVLRHQLRQHPDDPRLQAALEELPLHMPEVHTRERLVRWQAGCERSPDKRCLESVARKAIEIGALDIAWQVINHPALINGLPGRDLLARLSQVAIDQGNWVLADNCFSSMDHRATLTPEQYEQWFRILQLLGNDRGILDLQAQGVMNTPKMQLEYAQSLATRAEKAKLADYLESHFPVFSDRKNEHAWIQLIYRGARHPVQQARAYRAALKKAHQKEKQPRAH